MPKSEVLSMEREARVVEESLHPGMELTVGHLRMHLQRMIQRAEGVLTEEEEEEIEAEVES